MSLRLSFYPSLVSAAEPLSAEELRSGRAARRRQNDNLAADRNAPVKIDDVLVEEADTAAGRGKPDGPWIVGTVDAVKGIDAVLIEVERARTQGILRPTRHAFRPRRSIGIAGNHLL